MSELVLTVLSQHTSDRNSGRAFDRLKAAFPTWEAMADANLEAIAQAIWVGGLARMKAPRIRAILRKVKEELGSFDLSFLELLPLAEAKAWLLSLPGVGPKTAACVLLFSLGRPALPVDTHVYRVAWRLGLIDVKASADQAHGLLEAVVPEESFYHFHISLVQHGRRVCKPQIPLCHECVLAQLCPSAFAFGPRERKR
jgi:endonuclease-3